MPPPDDFYQLVSKFLLLASYSGRNADGSWRYGPPPAGADGLRHFAVPERAAEDLARFDFFYRLFPRFNSAIKLFEDIDSTQILVKLIAYRILGPERIELPISNAQYGKWMQDLTPLMVKEGTYTGLFNNMSLDLYDLNPAGIPVQVNTGRSSLLAHFFLKQYEFNRNGQTVAIAPGDTVIEGGMCFGDTGLFFAHLVGERGCVVGYEFEPNNLKILEHNLSLNPELAKRIRIKNNALSDQSGQVMEFVMNGPATCPYSPEMGKMPTVQVKTLTIDDLVRKEHLNRVDYIKLDVEGAEMATMRGAEETLRRFKPKLALSAYHKHDDVPALTEYLHSLNLGYKFWLDHFRAYDQETVLFAKV